MASYCYVEGPAFEAAKDRLHCNGPSSWPGPALPLAVLTRDIIDDDSN
jgi:hypothetical protein